LFKSYKKDFADGEQKRDFVYVTDCVDIILWMLYHPSVSGLFNIGTGIAHTFKDIVRIILHVTNLDIPITYIDMPENIRIQYQYYTQANIEKLRNVGYTKPMTSLELGIKKYINDFLINKEKTFEYEPHYI